MRKKIKILVLSLNPSSDSRVFVDEEAREIFERLQEGPYRDMFQLHNHAFTNASELQRLLLIHEPNIIHFTGRTKSKRRRVILRETDRQRIDHEGLPNLLALYNTHVRLVLLSVSLTRTQARSISKVINYSIGMGKGISDEVCVTFAGAFYRALGFGKSIPMAFRSARAELALRRMLGPCEIDLFVRNGVSERDRFPRTARLVRRRNPVKPLFSAPACLKRLGCVHS